MSSMSRKCVLCKREYVVEFDSSINDDAEEAAIKFTDAEAELDGLILNCGCTLEQEAETGLED